MNDKKKLSDVKKIFGIKIEIDKSLDIYSGKVLFPESLRRMKEILKNSKNLDIIRRRPK
jgi:hypothetical protein